MGEHDAGVGHLYACDAVLLPKKEQGVCRRLGDSRDGFRGVEGVAVQEAGVVDDELDAEAVDLAFALQRRVAGSASHLVRGVSGADDDFGGGVLLLHQADGAFQDGLVGDGDVVLGDAGVAIPSLSLAVGHDHIAHGSQAPFSEVLPMARAARSRVACPGSGRV